MSRLQVELSNGAHHDKGMREKLLNDDAAGGGADGAAPPDAHKVKFKELFRFADRTDRMLLTAAFLAAAADGVTFPSFSFLFAGLLDAFSDKGNLITDVQKYAGYLALIAGGSFIVGTIRTSAALLSAERQGMRMRVSYLRAVLSQEQAYHDTHATGETIARMAEDTLVVMEALGEKLAGFVTSVGTFTMSLTLGFVRGPDLAGVVCAFVPPIGILGCIFAVGLTIWTKREQDAYAAAGAAAAEALSSMRTVAAYAGEGALLKRYSTNLRKAESVGVRKGFAMGATVGAVFSMLQVSAGAVPRA